MTITRPTLDGTGLSTPAANTAATVTITPEYLHVLLKGLQWSYNASPSDGRLYITSGGTTVWDIDITTSGSGFIGFSDVTPPEFEVGHEVVVTLTAGGQGVTGKLNVQWILARVDG